MPCCLCLNKTAYPCRTRPEAQMFSVFTVLARIGRLPISGMTDEHLVQGLSALEPRAACPSPGINSIQAKLAVGLAIHPVVSSPRSCPPLGIGVGLSECTLTGDECRVLYGVP